jgi:hypothetical protein
LSLSESRLAISWIVFPDPMWERKSYPKKLAFHQPVSVRGKFHPTRCAKWAVNYRVGQFVLVPGRIGPGHGQLTA